MSAANTPTVRIGVAGLGRAFTLMLPTFVADRRVRLVAACDPRADACARFRADFSASTYSSVEELCYDPQVDVVYIATPHAMHVHHACAAARRGKHVLVEKPLAITLAECDAMIEAARQAGTCLIVGHSHSFDAPIAATRRIIGSGEFGAVRMIHAQMFGDFLYRPRRPEELDTAQGGGVVFSQAAHQIDTVRLLGGGMLRSVRAYTGAWDATRPTEGAYAALLGFEDGAFASLVYSGYAHYDSDEACDWIGELGTRIDPDVYRGARTRAAVSAVAAGSEAMLKAARNYGGADYTPAPASPAHHQHFGPLLVCCDRADLRPTPRGIMVYGDADRTFRALPDPLVPRIEVIDELVAAVVDGVRPQHDGEWSRATIEACLALLESSSSGRDIPLRLQVPTRDRNVP